MKIILTSKVRKLGEIGDVVNVKDGYGKNYLIPNKYAIVYTPKNYAFFEKQKQEFEKANAELLTAAQELAKQVSTIDLVMIENASDDGKLYGSTTTSHIATVISAKLGAEEAVKKSQIVLKNSIKTIGKYTVILNLHPEVVVEKDLIIARNEEEAKAIQEGKDIFVKEAPKFIEIEESEFEGDL